MVYTDRFANYLATASSTVESRYQELLDPIINFYTDLREKYGTPLGMALLPCLHALFDAEGELPTEALKYVSLRLSRPMGKILEIAAFHDKFKGHGVQGRLSEELFARFAPKKIIVRQAGLLLSDLEGEASQLSLVHEDYDLLKRAISFLPEDLIGMIELAGLRGRGGAGFPTHLKWASARDSVRKRKLNPFLVVNADEGEPPTVKDRVLMRRPHRLIASIVACAYTVGAPLSIIYTRGDYVAEIRALRKAITDATAAGYLGKDILGSGFDHEIMVYQGAGSYLCGADTAQLNSIEGKFPSPRAVPPYPTDRGLNGHPTVVNNVETVCSAGVIFRDGPEEWRSVGGSRVYSVFGSVVNPGVYECPENVALHTLIELAGGHTREFKAAIPGGISAGFETDLEAKLSNGTGAVVILDQSVNLTELILQEIQFYGDESCGRCSSCRYGTSTVANILTRRLEGKSRGTDIEELQMTMDSMASNRCGLGKAVPVLLEGAIRLFPDEFV